MLNKMLQKKLIRNFIIYGKIKSTENRIRFLKTNIEKMINLAKKNTEASKNEISKKISHKETEKKLFQYIVPTFKDKKSGYVRHIKMNIRMSDGSRVARLEWSIPVIIEKVKEEIPKIKKESKKKDKIVKVKSK